MRAEEQLDYLIWALDELISGKEIDLDQFAAVCRDEEARAELDEIMKNE